MFKNVEITDLKKIGWGFVAGAVVLLITIFSTGWVVTSSTAKKQAVEKSTAAVDKRLAEICVKQFKHAQNIQKKLNKMQKMEYSWDRSEYIKENGWATMPYSNSTSPGVADNCAKRLMQMAKKKTNKQVAKQKN